MGGHVFTDGSGGAETKDTHLRRRGFGVEWILSNGGLLNTLGGRAGTLHGRNQSVARAELLAAVEALRLCRSAAQQVFIWTDCMFVVKRVRQRETEEDTCPTLLCGRNSGRLTTSSAPQSCSDKVWRSHATEAEIAAGLISPLDAYGNEAADKLAARGALRNASLWSMFPQPATQTVERGLFKTG